MTPKTKCQGYYIRLQVGMICKKVSQEGVFKPIGQQKAWTCRNLQELEVGLHCVPYLLFLQNINF